jgi:hypothetical protein
MSCGINWEYKSEDSKRQAVFTHKKTGRGVRRPEMVNTEE